jgi:predicted secreted protein
MWFRIRANGLHWIWALDRQSAEEGASQVFGTYERVWAEERA